MTDQESESNAGVIRLPSGVPLGGIGTGAVELGRDGRFRNITINNNRDARTRIPVSSASFLALRVANERGVYTRILQQEFTPQREQTEPPRLKQDQFEWHPLYPQSDFYLHDPACPARVYWSGLAPIIPYDLEASSLPAFFVRVKLANKSPEPLDFGVLFNWENLVGVTRLRQPGAPASIMPVVVPHRQEPNVARMRFAEREGEDGVEPGDPPNGLVFGELDQIQDNADGQHCLAIRPNEGTSLSMLAWDHEHLGDWRAFWTRFRYEGDLCGIDLRSPEKKCGALCSSFRLAPDEVFSVDFVLTWYCPQYVVRGRDLGNWYATRLKSATGAAREGLRNLRYYSASVHNWQQRFVQSSLPRWFTRRLINSSHIFSTNSIHTREAVFSLIETPENPLSGRIDDHLYKSLAVLLFYPRLESSTLLQAATLAAQGLSRGWVSGLGELGAAEPRVEGVQRGVLVVSNLVIASYRNYLQTAALARAQELYPLMKQLVGSILALDTDHDSLPEVESTQGYEDVPISGLTSHAASLWVCALRAMADLAHSLRNTVDAPRYTAAFQRARLAFEERFWDESIGHYRWHDGDNAAQHATACHAGQLAGQWMADFLGFGPLFSESRMARALGAMETKLSRERGVANWCARDSEGAAPEGLEHCWLAHTAAHFDSLLLSRGKAEAGFKNLEKHFACMRRKRDLIFEVPVGWDLERDVDVAGGPHRHTSLLAVWYALFAVQGFHVDVPRQHIAIAPRLAPGMVELRTPVFTALSLGWLRYRETTGPPYTQQIHLSLESPMMVRSIELRMPGQVRAVQVMCELPSGMVEVEHEIPDSPHRKLLIRSKRPISVSGTLVISVQERVAAPARGKQGA